VRLTPMSSGHPRRRPTRASGPSLVFTVSSAGPGKLRHRRPDPRCKSPR
jgi:hypothetical protein